MARQQNAALWDSRAPCSGFPRRFWEASLVPHVTSLELRRRQIYLARAPLAPPLFSTRLLLPLLCRWKEPPQWAPLLYFPRPCPFSCPGLGVRRVWVTCHQLACLQVLRSQERSLRHGNLAEVGTMQQVRFTDVVAERTISLVSYHIKLRSDRFPYCATDAGWRRMLKSCG